MSKDFYMTVDDLGAAAYLSLHGFKVVGKRSKQILFESIRGGFDEFNRTKFDYLSSQYHDFDAKLMSLKKLGDYYPKIQNQENVFEVEDLGSAAYLNMNGFKIIGKRGKQVYFEVSKGDEQEFNRHKYDYLASPYHDFDSKLMSLKKLGDYLPQIAKDGN